jgi:hypothetical protein
MLFCTTHTYLLFFVVHSVDEVIPDILKTSFVYGSICSNLSTSILSRIMGNGRWNGGTCGKLKRRQSLSHRQQSSSYASYLVP